MRCSLSRSGVFLPFVISLVLISLCLILPGCGRKNPVSEVSVMDSGIEITDLDPTIELDWNAWRGPANDGHVPEQDLVTTWDNQSNIRWRSDIPGRGHGSPIVVGSSVYVATAIEEQDQQSVICLNREDGSEKWTAVIHQGGLPSRGDNHKKGTSANGTVACDGERLYVGMFNSDAIIATALDLEGNTVWQQEVGKFVSKHGYAPSPILYKSLVIFAADNHGGGYLAALDGQTGKIAWRVARGNGSSYSSPRVANVGGRDQLLISGCDAVASYDPATGKELWRTTCTSESTCGTIVTTSDRIFASGGYPDRQTVCLSPNGELIWEDSTHIYEPSMIVVEDKLVGIKDDGIAMCWSTETGQLQWKKRLGGNFSASPILLGDKIYVPNLEGFTFVFRAGDDYELIAKNRLGDDCYASPAVSGGQLFLRIGVGQGRDRREQVVCIGGSES